MIAGNAAENSQITNIAGNTDMHVNAVLAVTAGTSTEANEVY